MDMKRIMLAVLALMGLVLAACQAREVRVDRIAGPRPWTSLALNNDPAEFQFAIVPDRTGKHRDGVFESALDKMNLLQPEFVITTGDLIEGYTEDDKEIDQQWDEIQGFVGRLKMPFFYVPGNHDLSNPVQHKHWKERFGPEYYT